MAAYMTASTTLPLSFTPRRLAPTSQHISASTTPLSQVNIQMEKLDESQQPPTEQEHKQHGHHKNETRKWHSMPFKLVNKVFETDIGCVIVFSVWILFGMIVYHEVNDGMNWADAFYFSIQAGYSIGFGSLSETSQDSRAFSCFHVIIGGLVLSTVVSKLLTDAIKTERTMKQEVKDDHTPLTLALPSSWLSLSLSSPSPDVKDARTTALLDLHREGKLHGMSPEQQEHYHTTTL